MCSPGFDNQSPFFLGQVDNRLPPNQGSFGSIMSHKLSSELWTWSSIRQIGKTRHTTPPHGVGPKTMRKSRSRELGEWRVALESKHCLGCYPFLWSERRHCRKWGGGRWSYQGQLWRGNHGLDVNERDIFTKDLIIILTSTLLYYISQVIWVSKWWST